MLATQESPSADSKASDRTKPVTWLIAVLLLAAAAHGATDERAADAKLIITGSSTMMPLVAEMARRFEARYPEIRVEVRAGGSATGISDLRAGKSNIGMVSRPLLDSERDLFAFPVARDGIALVVHRDNPIRRITAKQTVDILTGKITNWKALGGTDAAVVLVWGGKGQGASELLLAHFNLSPADIRAQVEIVENAARLRKVESDANAIATVSVGESERNAALGSAIRLLAFDGVGASSKAVSNGIYPLARPLAFVTRDLPDGVERQFIAFALSNHVTDLVVKYDFVNYEE
jgi:phosphate transport system substrate-binding protein